jgi:hypothetical protein
MKLTVGDELPLKLGERVPRPDEPVALPEVLDCGGVLWIEHPAAGYTDRKHDSAPKPGGIPTKAAVQSDIERLVDKAYEQHRAYPAGHLEKTATEIDLKRRAAERVLNAQVRAMVENMRMVTHPPRMLNACPGCGVGEGFLHFSACWKVRPELLDDRPRP